MTKLPSVLFFDAIIIAPTTVPYVLLSPLSSFVTTVHLQSSSLPWNHKSLVKDFLSLVLSSVF